MAVFGQVDGLATYTRMYILVGISANVLRIARVAIRHATNSVPFKEVGNEPIWQFAHALGVVKQQTRPDQVPCTRHRQAQTKLSQASSSGRHPVGDIAACLPTPAARGHAAA